MFIKTERNKIVWFFQSCFKFVEDSLPINLGNDTGRDSILLTFMLGSSGTLLEYSKLEASNRGYSGATFVFGPCREKPCLLGVRQGEFQTRLLSYRD